MRLFHPPNARVFIYGVKRSKGSRSEPLSAALPYTDRRAGASEYTCENIDTHQKMTKSKRMFAEMLVQARGHGDADDMAKTMSLVDIIYEIKKEELKKAEPVVEPVKESPPPVVEEKKTEPEPVEEPEPIVIMKIKDFWSRLTHDSDTD